MPEHADGQEPGVAPPGEAMAEAFARWAAAERAVDAASERTRQRWMRQQAADAASLEGVLVDLAERQAPVVIRVGGPGGDLRGRLVGVGQDFVVLEDHSGATSMVVLPAVDAVAVETEPQESGPEPGVDRRSSNLGLDLAEALFELAADRAPVRLRLAGGQAVAGDLLAVGRDVLWLREPTARRTTVYVPLGAILVCTPR